MKISDFTFRIAPGGVCILLLIGAVFVCPGAAAWAATTALPTKSASNPSTVFLGLPRMKSMASSTESRMDTKKFTIDPLLPQGAAGTRAALRDKIKYLAIEGGKEWARPLRGSQRDTTFVSFLAYASEGTVIEIGGAKLLVQAGVKPGTATVVGVHPNAPSASIAQLRYSVKLERHDNVSLAALPIFTIRIDPLAGVWDIYIFDRLLFNSIPLSGGAGARRFSVKAGGSGALICGLVMADDNPLFIDVNTNGVPDSFEKTDTNSVLLTANANATDRDSLIVAWKQSQRTTPLKTWSVKRLEPDGFSAR